ncbi:MAG: glycosyltransferase family 2 protein [Bacteroidaceae bacterium]|nr:glycosyltransferase family 2 protein [Bacteroidaceae bacterium]
MADIIEHKTSVCVLLSTYNGEKYLKEQLYSLYEQQGVGISLLVRDDGSTDSTHTILDAELSAGRLVWYTGENLKPAFSFWNLLQNASETQYYAFCDQDDVWDADKLKVATDMLSAAGDVPALYFCQTRLVDASLNEIESVKISPLLTYAEALVYHFVTGCTMVMNNAMRKVLLQYTPEFIRMHDIWIYDVAMAVDAKVFFDPNPHISYRQHGNNVIGQANSVKAVWKNRIARLRKNECIRSRLAKELQKGYSSAMSPENRALTDLVANYKESFTSWMRLLFTRKIKCAPLVINLSSKVAILLRIF